MLLHVYSLTRTLFADEAAQITCPTESGEVTILDHHRPLISILKTGTLAITKHDGEKMYFPVKNGFLEVKTGNTARFIVEE